jgi:hypothetical protein
MSTADLDGLIAVVLEDQRTRQILDGALASPGLERLVVHVLESQLADGLTERVLASPELERVVEDVATSPQLLEAITRQTQGLADEMAAGVRQRTFGGWLHRPPRPEPS